MDERLYRLNTTYAIVDTLVCVIAELSFAFAAWFFTKWWIMLFDILPLALFNTHCVVFGVGAQGEGTDGQNN